MHDSSAAGPAPKVLIAEDEFLLALEIEELVRGAGCRVVGPAAGVAELLALLDRLEEREFPLLTWGFTDGAFRQEEVVIRASEITRL